MSGTLSVGTRVGCASLLLTASQKLVSSARHGEWSITAVRLPIKDSCECKDAHVRTPAYICVLRNSEKTEMLRIYMILQIKWTVNFFIDRYCSFDHLYHSYWFGVGIPGVHP